MRRVSFARTFSTSYFTRSTDENASLQSFTSLDLPFWKSGLIINKNPSHSVSNPVSAAFQSSGDSFYLINNGLSKLEETVFMVYFHSTRFLSDKIIQKYLKLPLLNYAVFVYRNWKRSK